MTKSFLGCGIAKLNTFIGLRSRKLFHQAGVEKIHRSASWVAIDHLQYNFIKIFSHCLPLKTVSVYNPFKLSHNSLSNYMGTSETTLKQLEINKQRRGRL